MAKPRAGTLALRKLKLLHKTTCCLDTFQFSRKGLVFEIKVGLQEI